MPTNHDDYTTFRAGLSATGAAFNGLSCNQANSLSGIAFAGYSTNGGTPLRALTDASTLNNVISFVKTLADDVFRTK